MNNGTQHPQVGTRAGAGAGAGAAACLRIALIAPALPPQLDGIGDYSAFLAEELARQGHGVRLLTVTGQGHNPIPGCEITPVFSPEEPATVRNLTDAVAAMQPDWTLLQYNPFSYGRRGFNPYLPGVLSGLKKRLPGMGIAVMAHETFMPWGEKLAWSVMNCWQRPQFWAIGQAADVLFLSTEGWANRFQKWFPRIPVIHLPVGANLHNLGLGRDEAKARLGIKPVTLVLGLFGTTHPSRPFDWVAEAYRRVRAEGIDSLLLYVGPHKDALLKHTGDLPVLAEGPFPADEVSRRIAAMDMMLAPYTDGISTRRGAFMASIQHGVASVTTVTGNTDTILRAAAGAPHPTSLGTRSGSPALLLSPGDDPEAFYANVLRLAQDAGERERIGQAGQALYDANFGWEPVSQSMLAAFGTVRRNK